ncbi:hypothetical protein ACHAWT_001336 [Skeletonema menzelii]
MATSIASPPPSSCGLAPHILSPNAKISIDQQQQQPPWKSQAVNRTNELLSCARTALKIGQQQHRQRLQQQQLAQEQPHHQGQGSLLFPSKSKKDDEFPEWLVDINPAQLTLYQPPPPSSYYEHNNYEHDTTSSSNDSTTSLLSDSQSLLSHLDTNLSQLHSLVRKRGHTNDPTQQINSLISKFQEAAQELKQICELVRLAGTTALPDIDPYYDNTSNSNNKRRKSSGQRRKHYELVSTQLELLAKERMERLKVELETRSRVLRDQTNRRKLLATGGGTAAGSTTTVGANGTNGVPPPPRPRATTARLTQPSRLPNNSHPKSASSQFQSPLFTATSGTSGGGSSSSSSTGIQRRRNNTPLSNTNPSSSSGYSGYAGYGGTTNNNSSLSAGYGGVSSPPSSTTTSTAPSFATGIRQRKQQQQLQSRIQIDHGGDNHNDDDKYNKDTSTATVQQQIQERRQNRAAQSRLASARLAEKSIAELGVMFTKISTLISQQGEVLERIEDDVEAAGLDIDAGHDELVKVYGMTKGNRGLILKVFGILIFLIMFMKLY